MALVPRTCEQCGTPFQAEAKEVNRGYGRFCKRKCSARFHANRRSAALSPDKVCAWCGEPFRRGRKKPTKTGLYFCCRAHKDAAQGDPRFKQMHPAHYGRAKTDHREIAMAHYPHRCNRCGYDKYAEVLQVHHRDEDHSNNAVENLEVLCPTCHTEHHFEQGSGIFGSGKPPRPEAEESGIMMMLG